MKKILHFTVILALLAMVVFTFSCKKDDDDDNPTELTPREKAIKDYTDNYIGSMVNDPVWTGNTTGCIEGTISQDARNKVIQRLNYFRRLCGLTSNVVENPDQHVGCQQAALVFKAQNQLSHYPTASWKCFTQAAADAAASSNIALGSATSGDYCVHSTYGVSGFIEDAGSNNLKVGHRAWFLMPGLFKLGIGSTNTSCCMQWKDNYNTSGTSGEFIAYPPAGLVPNQVVYPRWSFTVPAGVGFTNATVTMTDQSGAPVTLNIINKPAYQAGVYPLQHLVWEPNINPSAITADTKYTVTIANITGGTKTSYTYDVTIIPVTPSYKKAAPDATDFKVFMAALGR
jgi:hypothetical protein